VVTFKARVVLSVSAERATRKVAFAGPHPGHQWAVHFSQTFASVIMLMTVTGMVTTAFVAYRAVANAATPVFNRGNEIIHL
jgi:heme/copper-type cytochrome/quinol oxidase subunit 2